LSLGAVVAARRSGRLVRAGNQRVAQFDMAAAEPLFRQALAEAARSGRPRAVAQAAQSLYFLLRRQHRDQEAADVLEQKVDAHRRLDGVDGRWTAEWRNEQIFVYGALGMFDRLEAACHERLASDVRRHGARSLEAGWALITLGWALRLGERWDEAEARYRQALDVIEAARGRDDPRTGWALVGLAVIRQHHGDVAGAEATLKRACMNWGRVGHTDRTALVQELLVDLYMCERRYEDALRLTSAWFEPGPRRSSPADEPGVRRVERHAAVLRALGRSEEAGTFEVRARTLRGSIEARRLAAEVSRERVSQSEPDAPCASANDRRIVGPLFPSPLL